MDSQKLKEQNEVWFCQTIIVHSKARFQLGESARGREAKITIGQRDWLKLLGEKNPCEQVGTVPTFFLFARTNEPSGKRA